MLTTPSRLFKLIIPLTTSNHQGMSKGTHIDTHTKYRHRLTHPRNRAHRHPSPPPTTPLIPRTPHPIRTPPNRRRKQKAASAGSILHRPATRRQRHKTQKTSRRRPGRPITAASRKKPTLQLRHAGTPPPLARGRRRDIQLPPQNRYQPRPARRRAGALRPLVAGD